MSASEMFHMGTKIGQKIGKGIVFVFVRLPDMATRQAMLR